MREHGWLHKHMANWKDLHMSQQKCRNKKIWSSSTFQHHGYYKGCRPISLRSHVRMGNFIFLRSRTVITESLSKKELLYRISTYKMKRDGVKTIIFRYIFPYYNRRRIYTSNPGGDIRLWYIERCRKKFLQHRYLKNWVSLYECTFLHNPIIFLFVRVIENVWNIKIFDIFRQNRGIIRKLVQFGNSKFYSTELFYRYNPVLGEVWLSKKFWISLVKIDNKFKHTNREWNINRRRVLCENCNF